MKIPPLFYKRVAAYLLDLFAVYLFVVATVFFCVFIYAVWTFAGDATILKSLAGSPQVSTFARLSHVILLFSYFTLAHWYFGKTFGKWALGLEVKSAHGELGFFKALARTLLFFLTGNLTFGLGFLVPVFRKDGRTLHDLLCHTDVISKKGHSEPMVEKIAA
jgi:uncharacterized RDD family membrane protein YckC